MKGVNTQDSLIIGKNQLLHTVFDTTLTPFTDTSYKLRLHIFNTGSYKEEKSNSTVTFIRKQTNKSQILFQDSLFCMHPLVQRVDFDHDKVKDFLFFYSTGARANPTYHLYLVDTLYQKLKYVKGFENLPNPDLDTTNNIITSIALSGTNYYTFHRINSKKKLVNLGHGFETDLDDSSRYDKAIEQILSAGRE
jgi:hypothetical protein